MLRSHIKPELTPGEFFISASFVEAYCSKCLGDYIPTHVFPLNVYLGNIASYFERKEEETDCRGKRMALHVPGQWITKIIQLHGSEQKSHLHIFLRCK